MEISYAAIEGSIMRAADKIIEKLSPDRYRYAVTPRMDCSCLTLDDRRKDQCSNCRFFGCMGCTYPQAGYCARRAPTPEGFPMMDRSGWCGDYERRPKGGL